MLHCPICGKPIQSTLCPQCGFDESCNYEAHPTFHMLPATVKTISALQKAQNRDPVDAAMKFLQSQDWDQQTLAQIKNILLSKNVPIQNPTDDPRYMPLMNNLIGILRYQLSKTLACFQTPLVSMNRSLLKK